MRSDWEDIKLLVLKELIRIKFISNPNLLYQLLNTGEAYLSEDNTWHDNFYGNCTCGRCQNITGLNHLGSALMQFRDQLWHNINCLNEEIKTGLCQDEDKFYLEEKTGKVTWIYYNPDSNAGGQYVYNVIYHYKILEIMKTAKNAEDFFDLLGSYAKQYLYDIGEDGFEGMDKYFKEEPYDLADCSETTMKKIIKFAEAIELREQNMIISANLT